MTATVTSKGWKDDSGREDMWGIKERPGGWKKKTGTGGGGFKSLEGREGGRPTSNVRIRSKAEGGRVDRPMRRGWVVTPTKTGQVETK